MGIAGNSSSKYQLLTSRVIRLLDREFHFPFRREPNTMRDPLGDRIGMELSCEASNVNSRGVLCPASKSRCRRLPRRDDGRRPAASGDESTAPASPPELPVRLLCPLRAPCRANRPAATAPLLDRCPPSRTHQPPDSAGRSEKGAYHARRREGCCLPLTRKEFRQQYEWPLRSTTSLFGLTVAYRVPARWHSGIARLRLPSPIEGAYAALDCAATRRVASVESSAPA